jgi:NADH dehydrogenase FAD-containing subunit
VVPSHPDIFVVGDTAAVTDQPGVPGTAPPAKQMGRYVGRLIAARVAGGPSPPPFRYRHLSDLATIGRRAAVVKLGRLEHRLTTEISAVLADTFPTALGPMNPTAGQLTTAAALTFKLDAAPGRMLALTTFARASPPYPAQSSTSRN